VTRLARGYRSRHYGQVTDTGRVERLELHLPGLLRLLGESLYSDPRVAYRELVQNAHDACVRRQLADEPDYAPRISVSTRRDGARHFVAIADNGHGLDDDDIRLFLSTIGRGQTGELRSLLESSGSSDHERLVGQFGVGLISAFLVADRVEVRTRRGDRDQGYRWICEGQQTYRIEALQREAVGSEVVLRIREDRRELGDPDVIHDAVRHFARFLEVPIFVGDEAINPETLPWLTVAGRPHIDRATLAHEWCRRGKPLATIELAPFVDPELGAITLHGLLVIPEGSQLSLHELGEVGVLIRRMLITTSERDLLPPWARFVTGLVDCPGLEPTASREQVRKNPVMLAVKRAIAAQLLGGLAAIQRQTPAIWRAFLDGHGAVLKSWSARYRELFEAIADEVTFHTTRGAMTLPAYLEELGEDAIYYFDDDEEARNMTLLLESTSRPVIDARYAGDGEFLEMFARERNVRLVRQLEAEGAVVVEVAAPSDGLVRLAGWLEEPDLAVRIARYAPASLPAFVRVPRRVETQALAKQALEGERVHSALRGLLASYVDRRPVQVDERRTLFLNADNPLVQRLADHSADSAKARPAAQMIGAMARLVSGEVLAPSSLMSAYRAASSALEVLLGGEVAAAPVPAARVIPPEWATRRAGLSPKHARLFAANYATFEAVIAATPEAVAGVLGLPVTIAEAVRTLAREEP